MLGKLLKYEYKATSRYFIGLYIVLALLTIGNKIMLIDEGYLTFTLPATVGQHIASKMIVCITWVIATVVLTGVSIFVVTYSKDIDYARGISYSVQKLTQLGAWGYVAEGIIAAIVTVIGMPILMYACLSIGQLYTKHRVGNSYDISAFANQIFIFGIVLSIVVSIASYIATYYILSKKLNLE